MYHPYCHSPSALTEYLKQKLHYQWVKCLGCSSSAQVEQNVPLECSTVIALLSMEAEYIASTHAAKEAKWLAMLLLEIGADSPWPFPILADNQSAIALTKDNAFHSWTKHIDIPYHYIWEAVEKGDLRLNYVQTDSNLANIFTKLLGHAKSETFSWMLGLVQLPDVWGGVLEVNLSGAWTVRVEQGWEWKLYWWKGFFVACVVFFKDLI